MNKYFKKYVLCQSKEDIKSGKTSLKQLSGRSLNIVSSFGCFITDKINKLHEKILRLVYDDYNIIFETVLEKHRAFRIHHQDKRCLEVEIRQGSILYFLLGQLEVDFTVVISF